MAWIKEVSDGKAEEKGWIFKRFGRSNVQDLETD